MFQLNRPKSKAQPTQCSILLYNGTNNSPPTKSGQQNEPALSNKLSSEYERRTGLELSLMKTVFRGFVPASHWQGILKFKLDEATL